MSQNLISFQPNATDLAAVDTAIETLEKKFAGLIDLFTEQRSMGWIWCGGRCRCSLVGV